jgi:hypothetical protein
MIIRESPLGYLSYLYIHYPNLGGNIPQLIGWSMVFNATFNNISVISWRSGLLYIASFGFLSLLSIKQFWTLRICNPIVLVFSWRNLRFVCCLMLLSAQQYFSYIMATSFRISQLNPVLVQCSLRKKTKLKAPVIFIVARELPELLC